MRFHLPLLAAFLMVVGCASSRPATSQSSPQLRVLTYNIHIGIGTDDRLDLQRIANVIRQYNPDIVALQELDNQTSRTQRIGEPAELAKLTGMHVYFGKSMDHTGGQYGIGILSRYPITQAQVHRLPQVGQREPRVALATTITPDNGLPPFRFICTHLDHTNDEQNSVPQARTLNDLFAKGPTPTVLAGDLNRTPSTVTMAHLFQQWTNPTTGREHFTFPSTQPTEQIDYVLYRPAGQWRVVETKVIEEPVASDHRPLLVVLEPIRD